MSIKEDLYKEIENQQPEIITPAHREAIDKLDSGDFHLSFSKLRRFMVSPWALVCYMAKEFKDTAAMKLGALEHVIILEPKEFEKRYVVYSKEDESKTWGQLPNKAIKAEAEAEAIDGNKICVPLEMVLEAINRKNLIYNNLVSGELLRGCNYFEKKLEWDYLGYNWLGYIDGGCPAYFLDIKKVPDAIPRKLKWTAKDRDFAGQGFLYNKGLGVAPYRESYFICVDGSETVTTIEFKGFQYQEAEANIIEAVNKLNECRSEGAWTMNKEFWCPDEDKGYYTYERLQNTF